MPIQDIEERLATFKADVKNLSTVNIIRKHIIHGGCSIISEDQYFNLKAEIAEHFDLHTNDILVVGSAKLGFSIAPGKRYREFYDESDIDVVLVSDTLFDRVWQAVFDYWKNGGYWERQQKFKEYLFRGWIRPDMLPPSSSFSLGEDWWEFFRTITSRGEYGDYNVRGALYKSWYFLESYQEICVDECRQELVREL